LGRSLNVFVGVDRDQSFAPPALHRAEP
jgi:hypothetical protein